MRSEVVVAEILVVVSPHLVLTRELWKLKASRITAVKHINRQKLTVNACVAIQTKTSLVSWAYGPGVNVSVLLPPIDYMGMYSPLPHTQFNSSRTQNTQPLYVGGKKKKKKQKKKKEMLKRSFLFTSDTSLKI